MKRIFFTLLVLIVVIQACKKAEQIVINEMPAPNTQKIAATKTVYGPIKEAKFYKMFSGYSSGSIFEGSGIFAQGDYFYAVFDSRYKIGKIHNTLPINSSSNSLIGSGSGDSQFEGITYNSITSNWFVTVESWKNGSLYYPQIRQYDSKLKLQSTSWTNVSFNSANSNKAFESGAWIRRNGVDYLLCIVELGGKINVMQKSGSSYIKAAEFFIPVAFSDYSDLAVYGNKLAVLSQVDAQLWIGELSTTDWTTTGGTVYDFPTGDSKGNVGKGTYVIYANLEGVSFVNDSTIVTCTDEGVQSWEKYKDQSIQVWKLR